MSFLSQFNNHRVCYFYDSELGSYYYGAGHPMKPHRLRMTHSLLLAYGMYKKMEVYRPHPAQQQEMERFHSADYINFLKRVTPDSAKDYLHQLQKFNLGPYTDCFDSSHELLTRSGFQSFSRLDPNHLPEVATYNSTTKTIEYHTPDHLIVKTGTHEMVDFVQAQEAKKWQGESVNEAEEKGSDSGSYSNHVSLSTTGGHQMFVKIGSRSAGTRPTVYWPTSEREYHLVPANQLVTESSRIVKLLGRAENGIGGGETSTDYPFAAELGLTTDTHIESFISLYGYWLGDGSIRYGTDGSRVKSQTGVSFAPVKAADKVFLQGLLEKLPLVLGEDYSITKHSDRGEQLYLIHNLTWFKYFDGEYGRKYKYGTPTSSADDVSTAGVETISSTVARTASPYSPHYGCEHEIDPDIPSSSTATTPTSSRPSSPCSSTSTSSMSGRPSAVENDEEVATMLDENERMMDEMRDRRVRESKEDEEMKGELESVGITAPNIKSAKWFWYWVWRLNKKLLRLLVHGLRMADGSVAGSASFEIYTSSVRFRDELLMALLHAGYSAYFSLKYRSGTVRNRVRGTEVVARHDSWRVVYTESANAAEPSLYAPTDITKRAFTGTVYCVNVKNHLIIVRKAVTNSEGVVIKASKPIITGNCPIFDGMYDFCSLYSGGSIDGAMKLNHGLVDIAINWAGGLHHAKKSESSGFCYVNDIVLGILELLKYHARVLYIDIDIHHGDGVEEAFYTTDRVMTVSFHKFGDFFPGTGDLKDDGVEKGKYYSVNFPLNDGIDDKTYLSVFKPVIQKIMDVYRPGAVVLQCGADSLTGDRLGCFNLTVKGHGDCVKFVKSFGLPTLVLGGGGYNIRNVSRCWTYETAVLLDQPINTNIPNNDFIQYYGPEYKLHLTPSEIQNINDPKELEKTKLKILQNLSLIEHAPSVQMQQVPPDFYLLDDKLHEDKADPNVRMSIQAMDKEVQKKGEFYDGDEDQDTSKREKPIVNNDQHVMMDED